MNVSEWILEYGDTIQIAGFFGLLGLLALLERRYPRRPGPMERPTRWRANLGLTLINLATLAVLPIGLIGATLWAERSGWGLLNQLSLPMGAVVLLGLLGRALLSWGTHYLMHEVPLLWRLHRVHHLDTELDVSSTVRMHPLELVASAAVAIPAAIALGLSPWVVMIYELLDVGITLFSHANLRLPKRLDWVLRYIVVTPDLHRIHHSSWQPETDSNFGAVFPVWDLILGTFRGSPRDGHPRMRLGLDEVRGEKVQRLWWLLGSPFRKELRADGPGGQSESDGRRASSPAPQAAPATPEPAGAES